MNALALDELGTRAWDLYDQALARAGDVVVDPSMPILWFGDAEAYARSPLKIVTVGLNPSRLEFPAHHPWLRFSGAAQRLSYSDVLNRYFKVSPYTSWFGSYEPLLRGMGASYYPGAESIALHTDICSPVPTDPTWSRLGDRRHAVGDGFELWRDLVEALEPDVVLASVARRHLLRLSPEPADAWPTVCTIERERSYHVRMRTLTIGRHTVPVVYGRAAEKPFGTVSNVDKERIGAAVRAFVGSRGAHA